jgi:OmpA-OmpF porin, OOP family
MCGTPAAPRVEPAPQPAPAAARPAPVPNPARKVTLQGDANFATGSAALTPAATTNLDRFIDANRGIRIDRLAIAGYTDSTGSATLNQHLSAARAQAVQGYLTSHGVRAATADVKGLGSASPVASNATAEGRAKNRRVEIQVDGE